ncbi:MAG: hypothetical protein J5710_04710 [Treponema sp.]|nr:hypothetical protein [Treponema sp.]
MKKLSIIFLVLFCFVVSLTAEGKVDFSGDVETKWGVATPWASETSWNDSNIAGRFLLGNTSFTGKLDAYYDNSSAIAEGSVFYDAVTNSFDWSLDELWLDYTSAFWGIRIGRQKTVWGKADGIDITNVICPSDMSRFSAMTNDDSKLAIDTIRLSFSGNQFTADAYWIPFFTPAALPLEDGNTLRKFLVPSSIDFPIPEMNITLALPVTISGFDKPEPAIWNGEYGLKLSGYFSAFDVSFYGFYGWDDTPFLDYTITYGTANPPSPAMPNGLNISGQYKRMAMFGTDAAIPIKETVLRAEAAFFPQRHFQKSSDKIIEENMTAGNSDITEQHNEFAALIGLDWMPGGWTITAQYYCDYVFGDLNKLERTNAYEHGATLSISKSLVNETLELSLAGILGLNDFDSLISPSINYSLSDQIKISTGAYIFMPGPERDGQYGAYKDLSSIYFAAKFSF